jgi:hypothetical protein
MGLSLRGLSALWTHKLFDPNDSVLMHQIGRVITLVISSAGTFATYVAARYAMPGDRGARTRAIYAALLYASAAELVSHGRYAVTDACLVALVAGALACSALFLRGGRSSWAVGTFLFAAGAAAFKVTAATALVIPLAAFVVRPVAVSKRTSRLLLLLVLPAAAVVFFALNPHVLIHWQTARDDIAVRINQYREGRVPEFAVRRAGFDHLFAVVDVMSLRVFHLSRACSAVVAVLSVGGLVRALRGRSLVCVVGVVHALLVLLSLAFGSRAFLIRNYLVAVPVLCIGFGFALDWVRVPVVRATVALGFAVAFVAVPLFIAIQTELRATDTRVMAMDWIAAHATGAVTTVAFTPEVGVDATGDRKELRDVLKRPHIVQAKDVDSAAAVARARPDYVLVVSHPDFFGRGDIWPFRDVQHYRQVAEFDANPYEHDFDVTPTWMGRFNAVVLERQRE